MIPFLFIALLSFPLPISAPVLPATLFFSPEKAKVTVGDRIDLEIKISGAHDLFGAPFHLLYPADLLEILKVEEQTFLKKDGKQTAFLQKADRQQGEIMIGLTRLGKTGGVDGEGVLITLTLRAKKSGLATLSFWKVDFRDSQMKPLQISARSARILIEKKKSGR